MVFRLYVVFMPRFCSKTLSLVCLIPADFRTMSLPYLTSHSLVQSCSVSHMRTIKSDSKKKKKDLAAQVR